MNLPSPPRCKTPRPYPLSHDNSEIQPAKKKHKADNEEQIESPSRQIAARIHFLMEKIIPHWEEENRQVLYKSLFELRKRSRIFVISEDLIDQKASFKSLINTIRPLQTPLKVEEGYKELVSELHGLLQKEELALSVDQYIYIFEKAVINQRKETLEYLLKMQSLPTSYQIGPRIFTNAIHWPTEYIKVIFDSFPKLILRNVSKEYHFALFKKGLLQRDDDFIKLLLQKRGSVRCVNENGEPLISTLNYFQAEKLLSILEEGTGSTKKYLNKIVNQQDAQGGTAIERAIELRNVPLIHILKKYGAEINPLSLKFETQMTAIVNCYDSHRPTHDYIASKDNSEMLSVMLHGAVEKCSKFCSEKGNFLKKCTINAFKAGNDDLSQIFRNYGVDLYETILPLISNVASLEEAMSIVERVFKQINSPGHNNLNISNPKLNKFNVDFTRKISKFLNEKPQLLGMFLDWSNKMELNVADIKMELLHISASRSYPRLVQQMLQQECINRNDIANSRCDQRSLLQCALENAVESPSPEQAAMAEIFITNSSQEVVDECFKKALINLDADLPFERVYEICALYLKPPNLNQKIALFKKQLHPLVWATISPRTIHLKSIRVISWLLNKNVDVKAALENAVQKLSNSEWEQFIELFEAFHINVELRDWDRKNHVLFTAIKDSVEGKLTYLINHDIDLTIQDNDGLGALSYAARSKRSSLLGLFNQLLKSVQFKKCQFPTHDFTTAILILYSLASKTTKSHKYDCSLEILQLLVKSHREMHLKPLCKSDFLQNSQSSKYPEFFVKGWESLAYDYSIPKNVKSYAELLPEADVKNARSLDLSIEAMHLWRSIDFSKHKLESKVEFGYEDFQEDENPKEIQSEVTLEEFRKGYDQVFHNLIQHVYYQGIPRDDAERKSYYDQLTAKFKFILFHLKKAKEISDQELPNESKEKKEKERKESLHERSGAIEKSSLELLDMEDEDTEEEFDADEFVKRSELKQTCYNDDDAFRLAQELYHASYNCGGNLLELIQRRYALLTGASLDPAENLNSNLMSLRQNLMQKVIKKRFTSNEREVHFSNAAAKSFRKTFGLPELPGHEGVTDPLCELKQSELYDIRKDLMKEYHATRILDETEEFIMKPPTNLKGVFDKWIVADCMKQNLLKSWQWNEYHSNEKFIDIVISSGIMNYIEDENDGYPGVETTEHKHQDERRNKQLKVVWDNLCKAGNILGIAFSPFEESIFTHLKKKIPKEQKLRELVEILKNAVEKTRSEDFGSEIYTEEGSIQRMRIIDLLVKLEHLIPNPDFIW